MKEYVQAITSHDDMTQDAYYVAQGIHYAISSARVPGVTERAFMRLMTVEQIDDAISRMVADGINTMDRVPRWLNEHYDEWATVVAEAEGKLVLA